MSVREAVDRFLGGRAFAVVGASRDRSKYGNKVLRAYQQNDLLAFPVNPGATEVEGLVAYPNLESLPQEIHGVSVITPPNVTEAVVDGVLRLGIRHVWMQPGAESDEAIRRAEDGGVEVISGGPCLLVALRYHE
jgi:predicted CoA-binding protein